MKCQCCNEVLEGEEMFFRDEEGFVLDTCLVCLSAQESYYVEDEFIEHLKDIGIDL
jgi:hypothetical protein